MWCRCAWWSGKRQGKWTGELIAAPMVQAALVSMELKTGQVRVLMGGKDFGDSTFNRATQARRQPGSAFKPILYAAAIEKGFRADSMLDGLPLSLPGGRHGQLWSPQNYDHRFYGPIPLAYALAHSRNVPAVRLMMAIGVPATVNMAKTLGITSPIFPNYASALGASDLTLMELTRAFSAFPNGGKLIEPVLIDRIEDRDGRVLVENRPRGEQVISPANRRDHDPPFDGRGGARHRHPGPGPGTAHGRQDRHHQQDPGRLVYRVHAVCGYRDLGGDG